MKTHIFFAGLFLASAGTAQQADFQPRMGEPVNGLSASELARFFAGQAEFDVVLTEAQGLGPIFNDNSCGTCHNGPTSGGAGSSLVTRFGMKASGPNPFDPLDGSGWTGLDRGGSLLQKEVIAGFDPLCKETVPVEADIAINRATPHTFGAGLLEALDGADITANAISPPSGFVSGMVRSVTPVEGGPARPGRFGWKGGVATVLTFSADASLNEMGLTNFFFPTENAPNGNTAALLTCDTVADPEDTGFGTGTSRIEKQTDFQRFLAPPPQTPRSGMTGETVFNNVGCADCHVATFTTATAPETALSGVTIHPYSDFLLHDMGLDTNQGGDGCGDGIVDGAATEQEMMTRALWGLGQRQLMLHDGRATGGTFAQNVDAAVQDHGGEAATSRAAYNALTPTEQGQLYAFLESLGRSEFDEDNDNDVDVFDWVFLSADFTGPGATILPDDHGAIADVDQDQDFDLADALVMQRAFTGQ